MAKNEAQQRDRGSGQASSGSTDDAAISAEAPRQRIAKAMARAGLCSRREAEAWVLAGRVKVNGETLASPARDVGPADTILVDDEPLPSADKTRLFLFHKPRGLVTSDHDPEGRETVTDFLRDNWPEGPRVVTVGRLDINTEGLLLLTNDGGLARTLELPATGWMRRYRVRAKGQTDQAQLDALAAGISIDGVDYAGIEAKIDRVQGSNCWLTMGLREGKNREIKRILEHLGLEVNRLIRLSFGPFQLLDLPEGVVEEVRTRVLRDQLGSALAAQAGVDFGDTDRPTSGQDRPAAAPVGRRASFESRQPPGQVRGRSAAPGRERHAEPQVEAQGDERAKTGQRRHVSASRALDEQRARFGPRKRIERSDTRDRHDRKVAVERLVSSGEPAPRRSAKRISPSAEAKRARVARSGAGPTEQAAGSGERRSGRHPSDARPARAGRAQAPSMRDRDEGRRGGFGKTSRPGAAPRGRGAARLDHGGGRRYGTVGDESADRKGRPPRSAGLRHPGAHPQGSRARGPDREAVRGERPVRSRAGDKPARNGDFPERRGSDRGGSNRGGPDRGRPDRGGPDRAGTGAGQGHRPPHSQAKRSAPRPGGSSQRPRTAPRKPGGSGPGKPSRPKR